MSPHECQMSPHESHMSPHESPGTKPGDSGNQNGRFPESNRAIPGAVGRIVVQTFSANPAGWIKGHLRERLPKKVRAPAGRGTDQGALGPSSELLSKADSNESREVHEFNMSRT